MSDDLKERREEMNLFIDRLLDDYDKHLGTKDTELSTILLKGHLLIEDYLNQLVVLAYDKSLPADRLSFYAKIKKIEEASSLKIEQNVIRALYRLNDVRNRLAHNLEFVVSISEIDTIGLPLGQKYILKKYEKSIHDRKLMSWAMRRIASDIFYYVYAAVVTAKGSTPLPKSSPTGPTSHQGQQKTTK